MIQKTNKKQYFRSFDEFAGDPQFEEAVDQEFGAAAPQPGDGLSRRRWLQLMGASMAFGSIAGCRMGEENIAPFVFRPSNRTPGKPEYFATSFDFNGVGKPIIAKCVDGRPIKLDGNPDHPIGVGGTDSFTQSLVLELYDPDRSRHPCIDGKEATWEELLEKTKSALGDGTGVAILTEPTSSPTFARLKEKFSKKCPNAKWFQFASISDDNIVAGSKIAFGKPHSQTYKLDQAKIVVSIEADPLGTDSHSNENIAGFVKGRDADHKIMNRLYAVESKLSLTGATADHRLSLKRSQMASFVAALEAAIDSGSKPSVADAGSKAEKIFAALASDLLEAGRGNSVIVGGNRLSPELNAQICRINQKLGNIGETVLLVETEDRKPSVEQIADLAGEIGSAKVETLLIFGANPVYNSPVDLKFGEALERVNNSIHFGYYNDETSSLCKMHGNLAHTLESWGDSLASDGSWLISQPLIRPIFGGQSTLEILADLVGTFDDDHDAHDSHGDEEGHSEHGHSHGTVSHFELMVEVIKDTAVSKWNLDDKAWAEAIHKGFIADSKATTVSPAVQDFDADSADSGSWKRVWDGGNVEMMFVTGGVYDGRFANNGWLQELPDFLSKMTWDNAAHVSPKTAAKLSLTQGKKATFNVGERSIQLPVNVMPGMAHGVVAVELGYGRKKAGRIGGDVDNGVEPVGHDIGVVRTTKNWDWVEGVSVHPTSTSYVLATTQEHFRMDNLGQNEINRRVYGETGDAPLVREGTYDSYMEFLAEHGDGHGSHGGSDHSDDSHGENGHSENSHAEDSHDHEEHAGGHGDGHHAKWPSDHHLHFKNVDITPRKYSLDVNHKWGMSIDLNKCIGCNACVVACQAENNIPIVGKDQVSRGRELHWLRIDRYFVADENDEYADDVAVVQQPVTCMHCEKAPCETVCPVAATTHSRDGLNDMVYNRCIGTRYCGNNCPYKVRRFNYLNYSEEPTFVKYPDEGILSKGDRALRNLVMNPEVTVRSRGVMEKCTFCVQRIQNTKILAKNEKREIRPNEIKTACQDACSAQAISFGDLHHKQSDVAKAHENPRAYVLLEELNNYPRTKYLARVRNPHPDVPASPFSASGAAKS